jgi:hypothetical protein
MLSANLLVYAISIKPLGSLFCPARAISLKNLTALTT